MAFAIPRRVPENDLSDTLIVIPARGGSQGIPHKAIKPLGGTPPIVRTVQTAREVGPVLVVTDDDEIARLATGAGAWVSREPTNDGSRTLDGSVFWAITQHPMPDYIATVQCTSPLLQASTIRTCLDAVRGGQCDSAITVRDDRHVAWTGSTERPELLTPWLTREALPARWVITGGCVATRREQMTPSRRFGGRLQLVPVSGAEAVDLDTPQDWAMAEWYASAPTARETLMARVLGDPPQWRGLIVQLSAWDESPEELHYRHGAIVPGRVIRVRGAHTYEEAELAVAQLGSERTITLVTSAYHQPRAFLTFLRVLQERYLASSVRLFNAPAPSRMDKLPQEWEKIRAYQAKGHVASYEEGLNYLNWRDADVLLEAVA